MVRFSAYIRCLFMAFVLSVLLLFPISGLAQNNDTIILSSVSNSWVEKLNDRLAMDISFNNSFRIFEVKTQTNEILLYPNTSNSLRFKVNYDFISVGFQLSPTFLPGNGDQDIRGKTKSFEMGTALIFKHWFSELLFSRVSGFYLKNTSDYTPWVSGDPYIQFPDLNTMSISLLSGYFNNSRFSFRSLSSQTERQLRSAGSFMALANLEYYIVDDRSPSVNTQKSNNAEISIGPGYAYTFVFKDYYYVSLGIFPRIGYLNTRLTTRTSVDQYITFQDNLVFRLGSKAGVGYNSRKIYTGLYATLTGARYRQENTTVTNTDTRVLYHIFFGVRIDAPDLLERQVKKVKSKMP